MEHADIRVFRRGNGAGLALETGAQIVTLGDVFRQHPDGDGMIELVSRALIDLSLPPSPDRGEDRPSLSPGWSGILMVKFSLADQKTVCVWFTRDTYIENRCVNPILMALSRPEMT